MSFSPKSILQDTFRKSLMMFITLAFVMTGNEILKGHYKIATTLAFLILFAVLILVVSYLPQAIVILREQWVAYASFKNFSPLVEEINDVLSTLKHEKTIEPETGEEKITETNLIDMANSLEVDSPPLTGDEKALNNLQQKFKEKMDV